MQRHVAILGAGPVGLDAALACADVGWPFTLYESGKKVAAHVRTWGHARLFTPWDLNASVRMRTHLPGAPTGNDCPTGAELATRLLDPLAALPALEGRIRLSTRVAGIARTGLLKHEHIGTGTRAAAPFTLLLDTPGGEATAEADLVLDCTGVYSHPNPLGLGGIPAPGERALADRITRTLPNTEESDRWAGTVLLVGAGKSAQTAARDLAGLPGTRVEWVVRKPAPDWGAVPDDTLPGRQHLVDTSRALTDGANDRVTVHAGTYIQALTPESDRIRVALATEGGPHEISCDHVVALTGYTGDASLYRQLQVHECYATGAPMNLSAALLGSAGGDCLTQPSVGIDALRNTEPHFFILGAKSYGRLNTFLLRTGYQQIDELVAAYADAPTLPSTGT
ncbi:NAD(P)-binding domain-containing protein [Streptomyces sp. ISL-112]|uniref:FAD-dependent oxidoreductase n=1 Tax=unclassified Streptomyces TaxID=2593676 RepID=UPI001BEC7B86|nr:MULTISPECIES: FAD-dependent oxidoreductase [unclassified Streptomyces]MBT2429647.1 NAD(P)-binding domain-containing protein [Streptomyces sp. ISL-112]MBT2464859.1 NAD(P)-binding domain-containing protein [Streptomyces sp. ISL-63]